MANETIEVLRIPGTLFPRGPFDENASYKFLNIVESGGSGYVCLQPCTGIPVTNTAYWFKFVFKGDKGDAFTYADLTAEQKAELVRDATAAAQSAADDAAAALQKFNTIKAAIDAIDPQSTEGSIQTLAAKQGLLEADLNALGPKISGVAGGEVEPDVTWEDGLIYSNGNISTSIAYQKSNKIALKKGETLTFTGGNLSALAARAVAAYVDDTFSAADSRYYANNTSAESISYTATKDVDVIVSSEKTLFQGPIKITIPSKVAELYTTLKTSVSRINKLDDTSFGVLGSHNITDGVLGSNNTFGTGGTSALISVNGGYSYKIVGHRLHNVIYAFLKSYPSLGSAVVYATGASRQVISTAGTYTATGTIPSDAAYLLVSMTVGNVDWSPSKIVFNDEEFPASSQSIKDTLVELNSKITSSANELTNTFDKKISYSPTDVVENAGYFLQSAVGLYPTKAASSDSLNVVTDPISLNEGEILHFVGATIHSQPFVGALCLEDGTLRESIIENKGDGSYSYCATKDCYVVLSYDTRTTHYVWKTPVIPSGVSCRDIYMRYNVNTDNTYYDISSKTFKDGNQIWCSMTIEAEGVLFVDFSTYLPSGVTSPVALLVFLGDDDEYIKFAFDFRNLSVTGNYSNRVYAPIGTKKIVVCQRTGYAKDTTLHLYEGRKIPFTQEQSFSTMREMVSSGARGLVSVGQMLFKSKISSPTQKFHTQTGISNGSYFDANKSFAQYSTVGESHHIPDSILDGAVGEEISFVPEAGYLRKIVGKGEDDTFYIEFYPSSYGSSPAGTANRVLLEKTTDFVNFTTIAKGYNSTSDDGVFIPDIMLLGILIVKECADGSLIVGCKYRDASMSATDGSGNTRNNEFLGCLRISPDRSSMSICTGIDIDGNSSRVIGSHGLADGGTAYVSAGMYDWHLQVCGNRVLMSEYGSRDSLHDDWGRVWYSDDCGVHWKEVWQTRNHISEGVADGSQQPSHTHGIMIDPYSDTIWVIVGETNRNLYYTDKGMEATDNDWTCIPIRDQLILPSISYMQVVNGYPFKDRIVFGSDNSGIGALYAINRLEDGGFSDIEIAHEVLPFNFAGTTYCAGAQSRRDLNSPALLCVTRENHANTEEQNELLMQQHLGRVIATWDGINFFEIWHDNSYGEHTVKVNGDLTTRNIAYCTRDMQAWLLKNGDLVIKYAGRDYAYLGDTGYVAGYGDFCARCYIIRNAERYFAVK